MALCQKGVVLNTSATVGAQAVASKNSQNLPTCSYCFQSVLLSKSSRKYISSQSISAFLQTSPVEQQNRRLCKRPLGGAKRRQFRVVSSAAEGLQNLVVDQPPSSREEAVSQARTALQSAVGKYVTKQGRRKGGIAGQLRVQVEVPVADDSPAAAIELVRDVCEGVFSDKKGEALPIALFLATEAAQKLAAEQLGSIGGAPVVSTSTLHDGQTFPGNAGAVLAVGPTEKQIPYLRSIVGTAGSRPIIVINPEWPDANEVEESKQAFIGSFDVSYCFLPLNVEGLLSKFDGAVLKFVKSGPPKAAPWIIFAKGEDGLKPVRTYTSRPTPKDLEDIFYNYSASQSPVNKGIGFLRGLVGKGKK